MIGATLLLLVIAVSPDLGTIQADIERSWGDGKPARYLRTRCQVALVVTVDGDSFSDAYFPNTTAGWKNKVIHRSNWTEDIARKRDKHYQYYSFTPPGYLQPPSGLERVSAFNGSGSFVYTHGAKNASVHGDDSPVAKLNMDHFGDMIGFPGPVIVASRTVAGDFKEVYRLEQLIPSGMYTIAGEETVEGEPCVILNRPGRDRVWLARDKGWAIVRREWHWSDGGPLKRRISNRDFRPLTGAAWIPYAASMEIYGLPNARPGQRVGSLNATLLEVEANVPDVLFEPVFPDGPLVQNFGTGETYLKGGLTKPARDKVLAQLATYRSEFRPIPWYRSPWVWPAVGAAVLVVLALGLWWRKRR